MNESQDAAGHPDPDDPGESPAAWEPEGFLSELGQRRRQGGRYRLEGQLARGGMGEILRVWDADLRRWLAMKVVLGKEFPGDPGSTPDVRTLGRFLEEAQVTGQLDHPGVVPVHELGVDERGRAYFTMRLVKGRDLKAIFGLVRDVQEGWTQTRVLGVLLKSCEALAYAHSRGVVHRDLKPANIMVGRFGEVYVMDWGLARVKGRPDKKDIRLKLEGSTSLVSLQTLRRDAAAETADSPLVTMDGDVVGTPVYMSPEQARGDIDQVDARSDVYSMGAILYELLTAQMPYVPPGSKRSPRTILAAVQDGPPQPIRELNRSVPAELEAICERAMSRDRNARYADVRALAQDLQAYLEMRVVSAYERGALAEARKWVRRNRPLAIASAAAASLLFLGLVGVATVQSLRARELQASNEAISIAKGAAVAEAEKSRTAEGVAKARQTDAERALVYANLKAAESGVQLRKYADARTVLLAIPTEARAIEWRLLDAQTNMIGARILAPDDMQFEAIARDGSAAMLRSSRRGAGFAFFRRALTNEAKTDEFHFDDGVPIAFAPDLSSTALRSWTRTGSVLLQRLDWTRAAQLGSRDCVVNRVRYDPSGTHVLVGWADGSVGYYDARDGAEIAVHDVGLVGEFALCDDGLVCGQEGVVLEATETTSWGMGRAWTTWDARSGHRLADFQSGKSDQFTGIVLSEDGTAAALWGTSSAAVYDPRTGLKRASMHSSTSPIVSMTFAPHGHELLASLSDGLVAQFDVDSGARTRDFSGCESAPIALSVTGEGELWAMQRGVVVTWNPAIPDNGSLLLRVDEAEEPEDNPPLVKDVQFIDDGQTVLGTGNGESSIWDVATGEQIGGTCSHCWMGELAGSDKYVLSMDLGTVIDEQGGGEFEATEHSFRLRRSARGEQAVTWRASSIKGALGRTALSHDGTLWLAEESMIPMEWRTSSTSADRAASSAIVVVDIPHHRVIAELPQLSERCSGSGAFAPDDRMALVRLDDERAEDTGWVIWDRTDGQLRRLVARSVRHDPEEGRVGCWEWGQRQFGLSAAFTRDGERVAMTHRDGRLAVWSTRSGGEPLLEFEAAPQMNALAFSPDGTRIASAGDDRVIRLWELETGRELLRLAGPTSEVFALAFSPDGTCLASGEVEGVRLWRASGAATRPPYPSGRAQLLSSLGTRVRALMSELVFSASVEEALGQDSDLSPTESALALRMVRFQGDDSRRLNQQAWTRVVHAGLPVPAYELALDAAQSAFAQDPTPEHNLTVCGAMIRLGRLDEAGVLLDRVEQQALQEYEAASFARSRLWLAPRIGVMRAMIQVALGDAAGARAILGALDLGVVGPRDADLIALHDEVVERSAP
jgi:serine/threonine protein kinase/WD40 repeat protein